MKAALAVCAAQQQQQQQQQQSKSIYMSSPIQRGRYQADSSSYSGSRRADNAAAYGGRQRQHTQSFSLVASGDADVSASSELALPSLAGLAALNVNTAPMSPTSALSPMFASPR